MRRDLMLCLLLPIAVLLSGVLVVCAVLLWRVSFQLRVDYILFMIL